MENQNPGFKQAPHNLPIEIKYGDKIDLIQRLLRTYAVISGIKMTPRNIDLLSLCILYGVNSSDFRQTIVDGQLLGFKNEKHINTELSRLKKEGFLEKHPVINKKTLGKGLDQIEVLVNSGKEVGVYLHYERK